MNSNPMERLRKKAEQALNSGETGLHRLDAETASDLSALLQELRVYHAELEIQNSELIASQHAEESNRRRYQTLFASLPMAAFVVDDRGIIDEANEIAAAKFGFRSMTQLQQHSLLRLASDEGAVAIMARLRPKAKVNPSAAFRVDFLTPSGDTLATKVHVHKLPANYHLDSHFLLVCEDLSIRLELADTRQLLKAVIDNSSAAIYAFDTEGRCILANAAFTKLIGCSANNLLIMSLSQLGSPGEPVHEQ